MNKSQLRIVKANLRRSHEAILAMNGVMINSLHEVLRAVTDTQVEMVKLFAADNDLDDIVDEDDQA